MFELRNGDVFYKSPEMADWVHFGKERFAEPTEQSGIFAVKKFNLKKGCYEIDLDVSEYFYAGETRQVKDGFFAYNPPQQEEDAFDLEGLLTEIYFNQMYQLAMAEMEMDF